MTRRARSLGTFGLVLTIAAVWFLPWVVSGDLGQPFSEDLGGTVVFTVPLLIALDAIRRDERVVAVAFLLPMTALFAWAGAPGPEAAVANGAPHAETGIGALVALAGCALAYVSMVMRRPARPARRHTPAPPPGIDIQA